MGPSGRVAGLLPARTVRRVEAALADHKDRKTAYLEDGYNPLARHL